MLQPVKKEKLPKAESEKETKGLAPIGVIETDHNYIFDLAELDSEDVLNEQESRFLLAFGTSFHVFQYTRRVKGNAEALQILGDIDSILTNKVFIDAYEGLDKEILDTFWFNLSDASKYYIDELVSRLLLISKSK